MDTIIKWIATESVPVIIITIAVSSTLLVVLLLFVIAFIQGKEISFWPPKIQGQPKARSTPDNLTVIATRNCKISENILQQYIIDRLNREDGIKFEIISTSYIKPEEGRPENPDTPFINFFIINKAFSKRSDHIYVLFR